MNLKNYLKTLKIMNKEDMLEFTIKNYTDFKEKYNLAVLENKDTFIFQGREVLTLYAKYLLEYLDSKLKKSLL